MVSVCLWLPWSRVSCQKMQRGRVCLPLRCYRVFLVLLSASLMTCKGLPAYAGGLELCTDAARDRGSCEGSRAGSHSRSPSPRAGRASSEGGGHSYFLSTYQALDKHYMLLASVWALTTKDMSADYGATKDRCKGAFVPTGSAHIIVVDGVNTAWLSRE